jgi:hypothetical protein
VLGAIIGLVIAAVVIGLFVSSLTLRRHRESLQPRPGWTRTSEVFNDPSTNRVMRVWLDEAGERHYIEEGRRTTA